MIGQYIELLSAVRRGRYDLVYTSFHGLPYFFFVLAPFVARDKLIYGIHNVHTPKGASNERWMRLYQRFAFKVAKRFHVFSRNQLATISRLLPSKAHYYAPLAPDNYGAATGKPPADKIRFLFFGYIRAYKRLDLLIAAFRALQAAGRKNIELVIAGSCDNWDRYAELLNGVEGVDARISMVDNADIPELVAACHYLVLPYQDGAQSAVLGLAYHYNKPVIASDIASFKEGVVPGVTGFLFENLSQTALTDVMQSVVDAHDERYSTLCENVRQHVRREYALDGILARYRTFLDDAIGAPQRQPAATELVASSH